MILIDVRTKREFESGHIEGAIHHDIMDIMQGKYPDVPKDAEIVLCCESGNRSMMACGMLKQAGFTNVSDGGSIYKIGEVQ